ADDAAAEIAGVRERPVADAGARAIVAQQTVYPSGFHITPHWHARAQLLFAIAGTMSVRTPRKAWIVPPSRALWIPARTVHEIRIGAEVHMRSLYIERSAAARMWDDCVVLEVTPLARELILRAGTVPLRYEEDSEDGLLMHLLL